MWSGLNVKRRGGAGMVLRSLGRQVASQQHSRSSEADKKWQLVTWSLGTWGPWGLKREGRRAEGNQIFQFQFSEKYNSH